MERGSLADHIRSRNPHKALSLRQKFLIAKGTAQGLSCLQKYRLLHLDLKPGNILLDGNHVPKIADFGLSIFQKDEHISEVGSPFYMSPEVWNGNNYNQGRPRFFLSSYLILIALKTNLAADVYSFGIVLWELMRELEPYERAYDNLPDLKKAVCINHARPTLPIPNVTPTFSQWLPTTWAPDPKNRVVIDQLMNDTPAIWDHWAIESILVDKNASELWKSRSAFLCGLFYSLPFEFFLFPNLSGF